jgi:sugar phosphate isomerase/epimerase
MLIGTMNHPGRDLFGEIAWTAEAGFDFIDLTLEPPLAAVSHLDFRAVRASLEEHQLPVIGHTAYYLPLCHPFESVRRAVVEELKICLEAFAALGAKWMNIHPDSQAPFHNRTFIIEKNLETIRALLPLSRELGVGLMIENLPGTYNTVRQISELMDGIPELALHLDIGHANLLVNVNTTDELLNAYGKRLQHVHLHDNKGGATDLHLPLGTGTVDTVHCIRSLQTIGYDGTITLEVFSPDRAHLAYSKEVLRRIWEQEHAAKAKEAETRDRRAERAVRQNHAESNDL